MSALWNLQYCEFDDQEVRGTCPIPLLLSCLTGWVYHTSAVPRVLPREDEVSLSTPQLRSPQLREFLKAMVISLSMMLLNEVSAHTTIQFLDSWVKVKHRNFNGGERNWSISSKADQQLTYSETPVPLTTVLCFSLWARAKAPELHPWEKVAFWPTETSVGYLKELIAPVPGDLISAACAHPPGPTPHLTIRGGVCLHFSCSSGTCWATSKSFPPTRLLFLPFL